MVISTLILIILYTFSLLEDMNIGIKVSICLLNLWLVSVFPIPNFIYPHQSSSLSEGREGEDCEHSADIWSSGLNYRLQSSGSKMTVVAFIIMPAATHSYTIEALKGQAVTKQLQDTVTEIQNRVGKRLFERTARYGGEQGTEVPDLSSLFTDEDKILIKRRVLALRRNSLPPVVTHNMADDPNDPILNQIRRVQLFNRKSDRVKVVFHPEFLNQNNPILGMDYEEFVRGCHLGVFASYYEPWGYTP